MKTKYRGMEAPYYVTVIQQTLRERKRLNPHYSLRALSMSLSISPATLSNVLKQRRNLPLKYVDKVISNLKLSEDESKRFRTSLSYHRLKFVEGNLDQLSEDRAVLSETDHYRIISEWEYFAVFKLLDTNKKFSTPRSVARKLDIPTARAREVLEVLMRHRYIESSSKGYKKLVSELMTTADIPSRAIRTSHREILQLAQQKIDQVDIENRYYSSTTVAVDKSKVAEAKKLYREFREKMGDLLSGEDATEVFQYSFQLFPLSNMECSK